MRMRQAYWHSVLALVCWPVMTATNSGGCWASPADVDKDPRGMGALATDADRRDVERARKLHAFFSQPLAVAELYTNLLGDYVPLQDTLDGIEAILEGKADDVSEEKLMFIGGMDRYFRR